MRSLLVPIRLMQFLPWLFFLVGGAMALHFAGTNAAPGESGNAAIALLQTGTIANPYLIPTGPTAHVSPPLVGLIATIFYFFGTNTVPARAVLGIVTALMYALSMRAALRILTVAGAGRAAICVAGLLFLLFNMFLYQTVGPDRQWDEPFAALILTQGWLFLEQSGRSKTPYRSMIAMAALAGLGGLFSPAIFPTLAVSLAWMIWTYRKLIDIRRAALLSGAVVMIFLLPWGVRNRIELGQFIFSRSNFGLELAIGNAPGALGYSGSGTGNPLHPHDSLPAAREVARVGEVAYMHKMTAQALDWIRADPARFAMLCLTRLRLLFFPLPAMAGWYPGLGSTLPFLLLTLLGILRLGALASVVWLRARPIAAILYTVLPLAPYVLAHVSVRYESTTFFVSVVMISLAIDRALSRPSRQES